MKLLKKYMVIALCAVVLATTVIKPLEVEAVKGAPYYSEERIVDIALTKTGVVADEEMLSYTTAKVKQILNESMVAFQSYLISVGEEEATVPLYYDFIQASTSDSVGVQVAKLLALDMLDANAIVKYFNEYKADIDMNLDIYYAVTGKDVSEETNVTLSNELVKYIRDIFNEYVDTEADFVWVPTYKASDINIKWFTDKTHYDALVDIVNNLEDAYMHVRFYQNTGSQYFSLDEYNEYVAQGIGLFYVDQEFGLIKLSETLESADYSIHAKMVSSDWTTYYAPAIKDQSIEALTNNLTLENLKVASTFELYQASSKTERYVNGYAHAWLFSNDGRKVKVFKNLDAYKANTIGKDSYYVNDVSESYNTTDNSVTVSGDYITGSNYQYSYDVVQNEIDNTQNVDNSVVNNIVNNNTSTIINNYASSVLPDSDNSDNGDNGGSGLSSILDGLGAIISAVAEIVGFLLGVLGDIIGLIGDLFKTVFEGIKAIGTVLGDFPKLLGDIFVFIPQELINFLVLSIEASIGIAIWRQFSKK